MGQVQSVYKYPISATAETRMLMPESAAVVAVGLDMNGDPCVWVLVDPELPKIEERVFSIRSTGSRVPATSKFCGTFFEMPFVWHVFEELPA
jgi:hypothetical protein